MENSKKGQRIFIYTLIFIYILSLVSFTGIYGQQETLNVNVSNPGSTTRLREVRGVINHNDSILFARTDTTQELVARTIYVSMPTHPTRSGSDITGNGLTNTTAFATIHKALLNIHPEGIWDEITIQLDSGSFNLTLADKMLIDKLNNIRNYKYVSPNIFIAGNYTYLNTLTLTKVDDMVYTYTGGSYANSALEGYFLGGSSNPLYPIDDNLNDTVFSPVINTTYGYLYRINTTLNISQSLLTNFQKCYSLGFNYLNLNYSVASKIENILVQYCNMTCTQTSSFNFSVVGMRILNTLIRTYLNSTLQAGLLITNNTELNYCALKNKNSSKTVGLRILSDHQFTQVIFDNYLYAYDCLANIPTIPKSSACRFLFKNCTNIFSNNINSFGTISFQADKLLSYGSSYLIYNKSADAPINIHIGVLTNLTPTLAKFNPSSLTKFFVNPGQGTFISIPGIYPEYQQNQSVTLTNNSTDSISIADLTYNRSVELKLNLVRGTDYQTKTIKLLNTGTTYNFVQLGDSIQTGDLGVRFDGVYRSGGSNILKLKWHITNTGTSATLIYDAYRQNF